MKISEPRINVISQYENMETPKTNTEQLLHLQVRRVSCKNTAPGLGSWAQQRATSQAPRTLRCGQEVWASGAPLPHPHFLCHRLKIPPTRQNALLYLNAFMIQSHTQTAEEESFRTGQAVQHATPGDDGIQGVATVAGGQPDGLAGQRHLSSLNAAFPCGFCKHQQ